MERIERWKKEERKVLKTHEVVSLVHTHTHTHGYTQKIQRKYNKLLNNSLEYFPHFHSW